jgi:hypothetical protein
MPSSTRTIERLDIAGHAKLSEGLIVQLTTRRNGARELELRERRLGLLAEIAVDRPGVEPERTQPLLHAADEICERAGGGFVDRVRDRLLRMEGRHRAGGDCAERSEGHARRQYKDKLLHDHWQQVACLRRQRRVDSDEVSTATPCSNTIFPPSQPEIASRPTEMSDSHTSLPGVCGGSMRIQKLIA